MSGKAKAIIAHITLIGWIIALILNMNDKDEFASYYIRQYLGIMIIGVLGNAALNMVNGTLAMVWGVIMLVAWLLSLIGAITDKKNETPVVGSYFQEWFKGL
ncbi:MAG: hypothetical protein KBT53_05720 [Porticoccus sp.]|jgi:uncharacterized membrane protein|nr:hypothetical protein [Porticoccus sp.]MBQ0808148.1 hypothetical protein [Porticoccus sp.]MDX2350627.1 hypothetical protein [Porticoccus sp.]